MHIHIPTVLPPPEYGKSHVGSATLHDHKGREVNLDDTKIQPYIHPHYGKHPPPAGQMQKQQEVHQPREQPLVHNLEQKVEMQQGKKIQGQNKNMRNNQMDIYIYRWIDRERERERERAVF
jgi:hypothetical protein